MKSNIGRRIRNLERKRGPQIPLHLPLNMWTDAQLVAYVTNGRRTDISDEELQEIIKQAPDDVLDVLAAGGT